MKFDRKKELSQAMQDPIKRVYLCERDIFLFALYYFGHYFLRPAAPFHREMAKDLRFDGHSFLMWIMFREAAKTVWAKISVAHDICYEKKKNIGWVSHDLKKAARQVMGIAGELKGNHRIISDFGQLFWEDEKTLKMKSKQKTFSEFSTSNNVFIKAVSTKVSTRGDIIDQFRPDKYVIDDIENMETARSIQVTKGIIEFLEELMGGISVDCDMLVLGNKITRNGSVAWLEKHLGKNPKAIIHEVAVYDKGGTITWPDKYVESTEEARVINSKIQDKRRWVTSIEQKKYDLGSIGFEREMLLKPLDSAGAPIRLEWIRREKPPANDTMDLVVAVDPAISEKQTADFFSLALVGKHRETGKIYIIKSYKTRCSVPEQVRLLVNWHKLFPQAKFRIEIVAYQKALAQLLQAERKNNIYIPIEEFRPSTDKLLRVQAISPFVERGDVVFGNGEGIDDLIVSLCGFPFIDHDDDVDAMTSGVEHFVQNLNSPSLMVG